VRLSARLHDDIALAVATPCRSSIGAAASDQRNFFAHLFLIVLPLDPESIRDRFPPFTSTYSRYWYTLFLSVAVTTQYSRIATKRRISFYHPDISYVLAPHAVHPFRSCERNAGFSSR
jgi:hypothetical protein